MEFSDKPLAYRMRPKSIEEFVGQEHLTGEGKPIKIMVESGKINSSMIFWGPPGCGKTTLAKIISRAVDAEFVEISAVSAGKEDIKKAINQAKLFNKKTNLSEDNKKLIAVLSNGDARNALNILELAVSLSKENEITKQSILDSTQKTSLVYDKNGEEHYNIISAMHKSLRDSDADGAIYWVMRMIEAGEDPKYIVRRMIRFASEDVGNADTNALAVAISAKNAVEFLGYPECDTALIQCAAYLANAKKSNSCYVAVNKARADIKETGNLPVPLHLRNAETNLMKELGYGKGYKYAHNFPEAKVEQEHMPEELKGKKYYEEK